MTALHAFNQSIADAFNKPKPPDRVVLLQIDLSKAFAIVSHKKLLNDLNQTTLPDPIKRWFNCYLLGRQSRVQFRLQISSARNVRTGGTAGRGDIANPIQFLLNQDAYPTPQHHPNTVCRRYLSVCCWQQHCHDVRQHHPVHCLCAVVDFLTERDLIVSPEKSMVTLFTPDTKEYKNS